jgi:hypothetical protein
MQKNCFKFPLNTESLIKDYIRNYLKESNTKRLYAPNIELPDYILAEINTEMAGYGLPNIGSGMAFKRKYYHTPHYEGCHVDYTAYNETIIKTSIVIPIDGCEDTCMYWYDGDYSTEIMLPTETSAYGYPYLKINWNSPGTLVEQTEITNGPMLCRVDLPHSATSRKDGTYRLVMTLRFAENLSIEEIIARQNLSSTT